MRHGLRLPTPLPKSRPESDLRGMNAGAIPGMSALVKHESQLLRVGVSWKYPVHPEQKNKFRNSRELHGMTGLSCHLVDACRLLNRLAGWPTVKPTI